MEHSGAIKKTMRVPITLSPVLWSALIAIAAITACTGEKAAAPQGNSPKPEQTTPDVRGEKSPPPPPSALVRTACELPRQWVKLVYRGWDSGRSRAYDLALVPRPPDYMGSLTDTSHSGPYRFLQQIPLVFYGPGLIRPGAVKLSREVTIADVAPTTAGLLGFGFPHRDGRPISGVIQPDAEAPRLIVTTVIDGGGWNVLDMWRGRWPNIRRLMRKGASVEDVTAGSSPSITPAIHTSMSTGTFPHTHKITAIVIRTDDGHLTEAFVPYDTYGALDQTNPSANTDTSTLADLYDKSTDNKALVGMVSSGLLQFGMMSMGSTFSGGDKDIAAILNVEEEWATNPRVYSLPDYAQDVRGPEADLADVDRSDGQADGLWRGHSIPTVDTTPAFAPWENRIMKALLEGEGFGTDDVPDLFYVNYKAPDKAGHAYNMIAPEQGEVLESVDTAIGEMIGWLNEHVGRGKYVFILTADHGQTPLEAGGWPIRPTELTEDLNDRFDHSPNGKGIVQDTSASTLFMLKKEMQANGVEPETVARWLLDYTLDDNVDDGEPYPSEFNGREKESIFKAVVPGRLVDDAYTCSRKS